MHIQSLLLLLSVQSITTVEAMADLQLCLTDTGAAVYSRVSVPNLHMRLLRLADSLA